MKKNLTNKHKKDRIGYDPIIKEYPKQFSEQYSSVVP